MTNIEVTNTEAEKALLGSIIIDPNKINEDDVNTIIAADDFSKISDRTMFEIIKKLYNDNKKIDMVTITEVAMRDGKMEQVGGIAGITSYCNYVPSAASAAEYARIVKDNSRRRQYISALQLAAAQAAEGDVADNVSKLQTILSTILGSKNEAKDWQTICVDRISELENLSKRGEIPGLRTGLPDLDNILGGLQPGLICLAARPAMGKSALALNIALAAAAGGKKVMYCSLEMSAGQCADRLAAAAKALDMSFSRQPGKIQDWGPIVDAFSAVSAAKITMMDNGNITVGDIRARARTMMAQGGIDMIVLDYLQLLKPEKAGKYQNREQEVARQTRELKALSRELGVPVLMLAQLNRQNNYRQDKRPVLSDLRESGSIEQDCDIVMLLHRERYYDPASDDMSTELIVAKHRNGPIGTIKLFFADKFQKFVPLSAAMAAANGGAKK